MTSTPLDVALRNLLAAITALRQATTEQFAERAAAVRPAAKEVESELARSTCIPAILAEHHVAVGRRIQALLAALKPDGATYDDAEQTAVRGALGEPEAAAQGLLDMLGLLAAGTRANPLLSPAAARVVGILSASLFGCGALFAALGKGIPAPACSTLALWCGAGSLGLAFVWIFNALSTRSAAGAANGPAKIGSELQYLVFGGMAFLVLGLLVTGIFNQNQLQNLATIAGARGVITFLIAVGTIAIAVIVTLASILMDSSDGELKERLSKAKEVLSILVGVLGTIVGFYFANNGDGQSPTTPSVTVLDLPASTTPGAELTVHALVAGGQRPYDGTPILNLGKGVTGEGATTEQGFITAKLKVAADAQPGTIAIEIGARDHGGKLATATGRLKVAANPQADAKK